MKNKPFKVSTGTDQNKAAGAIASTMKQQDTIEIITVGAGAVNQATKAIAIARRFLLADGIVIASYPEFRQMIIGDGERTAMIITVFKIKSEQQTGGR